MKVRVTVEFEIDVKDEDQYGVQLAEHFEDLEILVNQLAKVNYRVKVKRLNK